MKVMIDCPNQGEPLFTGIAMDEQSFKTATLENNSIYCAHCNVQHPWSKADAYLLELQIPPANPNN